ncbi:hypothetical protein TWF730_005664 [Orbilia blumenaviensis]|uniref:Thioesterase domain-containing protein n=1 Tax=Orbilia blumenaviensis TaxID=1796055 RepID=A0AAV9VK69_9PEZI
MHFLRNLTRGPARNHRSLIRLNLPNTLQPAPLPARLSISPSSSFVTLSSNPHISSSQVPKFPLQSRIASSQARNMSNRPKDPREDMSEEELLALVRDSPFRKFGKLAQRDGDEIPSWGKQIYTSLEPVHATLKPNPAITFKFDVTDDYTNLAGNLHGGAGATIFDIATTMVLTLVQKEGFWERWGVSRTLNCAYLKGAPGGTTVNVHCEIVSLGKRLVHMRGVMTDDAGTILVTCEHGKVSVDSKI